MTVLNLHIKYFVSLVVVITLLVSCKREDVDVIGPEIAIASSNFELDKFEFNTSTVDFRVDSNWFSAKFNERVSWEITIKGTQSKAQKVIKGTSDSLTQFNTIWTGGHSGLYFFNTGEKVVAELCVFGSDEKWYDTLEIKASKSNYGENTILWWDMVSFNQGGQGLALQDKTVYWFSFWDGDTFEPQKVTEKLIAIDEVPTSLKDPVQGMYRSMEGQDGIWTQAYFVGSSSHTPYNAGAGFEVSRSKMYINFYLRARTATSGMSFDIISGLDGNNSTPYSLTYEVGEIDWEGWKLISVKLSDMGESVVGTEPFSTSNITGIRLNLQVTSGANVDKTGFDIDFITFTKGEPFNPDKF